jgi:Carboxypeptidase regulatory-like domain
MFTRSRVIAGFAGALILAGGATFAKDNEPVQKVDEVRVQAWDKKTTAAGAIKGTLIGENGKAFEGAEIHAQRVDVKAKVVIARTKPDGHYFFIGLPVGAYALTAYVDGVALSRASVKTRNDGWAQVNFDLRLNAKGADGTDRMQRDLRFGDGSIHPRDNAARGFGAW